MYDFKCLAFNRSSDFFCRQRDTHTHDPINATLNLVSRVIFHSTFNKELNLHQNVVSWFIVNLTKPCILVRVKALLHVCVTILYCIIYTVGVYVFHVSERLCNEANNHSNIGTTWPCPVGICWSLQVNAFHFHVDFGQQ